MVKPVVTHLVGCQDNVKHMPVSVQQCKMQLRAEPLVWWSCCGLTQD